jgi:hypothetical protein
MLIDWVWVCGGKRIIKDDFLEFSLSNWVNDGSFNQYRKMGQVEGAMEIKNSFAHMLNPCGVKDVTTERAVERKGCKKEKKGAKEVLFFFFP